MLFFEVSHASKVRCMIHKQDPHRSGAPDEPHDAPWPVQHAPLTCVHRPTRDRLGPPRRQTTCLQMRRRSKHASRPPRRCNHGGVGPPNDRGCSVRTPGRRRWSKFGSDNICERWCDHCRPSASRDGFHGRRGVAFTVGLTCSRASSSARQPRKGSPRAAILEILTIYGAKKALNPKTRDNEHAPPGPFCVGPTSRSDPTLEQCFDTTFYMHTMHLNSSGFFCLSSDAPAAALAAP